MGFVVARMIMAATEFRLNFDSVSLDFWVCFKGLRLRLEVSIWRWFKKMVPGSCVVW